MAETKFTKGPWRSSGPGRFASTPISTAELDDLIDALTDARAAIG